MVFLAFQQSRAKILSPLFFRRPINLKRLQAMLDLIQKAGWPIYPLLLCSILAVALMIERLIVLRRDKILPPNLLNEVIGLYKQKGMNADAVDKLEQISPLGRVLAAGLRNDKSSRYIMKEAIEEAGGGVTHELSRWIGALGTIASIAPLMGLFGTVVGMIEIFGSQSPAGGTNPAQLAHGISVALYNTGFGLVIAIPAMIAYRYFRARVDNLVVAMEQSAIKLLDIAHGDRRA